MNAMPDLSQYPGGDLVLKGLSDLETNRVTKEALLVLVASPRLRDLGFDIPARPDIEEPYNHRLFELLEDEHDRGAHAAYNALIQRIVSFDNSYSARPG